MPRPKIKVDTNLSDGNQMFSKLTEMFSTMLEKVMSENHQHTTKIFQEFINPKSVTILEENPSKISVDTKEDSLFNYLLSSYIFFKEEPVVVENEEPQLKIYQ